MKNVSKIIEFPLLSTTNVKVTITKKRMKNMRLSISKTGAVNVSIPYSTTYSYAYQFLVRKREWIATQLSKINLNLAKDSCKFVNNGKIFLLGHNYPLKVELSTKNKIVFQNSIVNNQSLPQISTISNYNIQSNTNSPQNNATQNNIIQNNINPKQNSCDIQTNTNSNLNANLNAASASNANYGFTIYAKDTIEDFVQLVFVKWCKKHFLDFFTNRLNYLYSQIFNNTSTPLIKIKTMKSMWGNCNFVKRVITLNLYLAKTPIECIDYVIVHELAHLVHHNHSKDFYALLTKLMPDWKARKKLLNNYSLKF